MKRTAQPKPKRNARSPAPPPRRTTSPLDEVRSGVYRELVHLQQTVGNRAV